MEEKIAPKLAFGLLKQARHIYHNGSWNEFELQTLYSFFGEQLVLATELLEICKIFEYRLDNGCRNLFKIITKHNQYTIYEDINFCLCSTFTLQVLEAMSTLTCKHVLAVHLAQISNQIVKEKITESQLVDCLNEQLAFESSSV